MASNNKSEKFLVDATKVVETNPVDASLGVKASPLADAALSVKASFPADTADAADAGSADAVSTVNACLSADTVSAMDAGSPAVAVLAANVGTTSAGKMSPLKDKTTRKKEKRQRQKVRKSLEKLNLQAAPDASVSGPPEISSSRKRTLGSTPGSAKPAPKRSRVSGPDFAGAVRKELAVYVGPCEGEEPITSAEFSRVRSSLTKTILGRSDSEEGAIRVESCTHYNGRVKISCADELTLKWIREEAKKLDPGPGTRKKFWVMGPGDLPPTRRCTAWVPMHLAESKVVLLDLLRRSNKGRLRVDGLHLTRETPVSMSHTGEGRVCIFAAEEDVFRQLEALQMRPYCGMGRLTLKSRSHTPDPPVQKASADCAGGNLAAVQPGASEAAVSGVSGTAKP